MVTMYFLTLNFNLIYPNYEVNEYLFLVQTCVGTDKVANVEKPEMPCRFFLYIWFAVGICTLK